MLASLRLAENLVITRKTRIRFCSFALMLVATTTKTFAFVVRRQNIRFQIRLCCKENQKQQRLSSLSAVQPLIQTDATERKILPPFAKLFELTLPEGRCVGISSTEPNFPLQYTDHVDGYATVIANPLLYDHLHEEEVAYALKMQGAPANQLSFVLGRMAMRTLLGTDGVDSPILKDGHGRPTLPSGYLGSISHKKSTAVALFTRQENTKLDMGIGVDLEYATGNKASIAPKILMKDELLSLGRVEVRFDEVPRSSVEFTTMA
jgi:hypothetical protein